MFRKFMFSAVAASALCSPFALAQGDSYVGANLASLDYSEEWGAIQAEPLAGYVRLGAFINDYLSGELRLGTGLDDDSVVYQGVGVDVELKSLYGAYLRAGLPVSDVVYPYALIGYTRAEVRATVPGVVAVTESGSDVAFGLGVDFNFPGNFSLNLEYTNYYDDDGVEIDAMSIGFATRF